MSTSQTQIIKTYTLSPNETWTIPPNAVITAITGDVDDPCDIAPDPVPMECYYFQWEVEGSDSGTDAWEEAFAESLMVGNTVFPLGDYNMNLAPSFPYLPIPANNNGIKNLLENTKTIFNITFDNPDHWEGGLTRYLMRFKTFPALAANMYLKLKTLRGTVALYPVIPYECPETP